MVAPTGKTPRQLTELERQVCQDALTGPAPRTSHPERGTTDCTEGGGGERNKKTAAKERKKAAKETALWSATAATDAAENTTQSAAAKEVETMATANAVQTEAATETEVEELFYCCQLTYC
ncbi:hypothetical protein PI125_g23329 [Phytophthora idaei]|nr:hypothetical protein PI125_g23329 [Phytophthora idaei]